LLEDACRTADIIQNLTDMLDLDEASWINIIEEAGFESPKEKRLILNVRPLLGEIRQQRLAMNRLMNQLGIGRITSDQDVESKQSQDFWAAAEDQMKG
jgi:endonuclease III-like uncharacterized protein